MTKSHRQHKVPVVAELSNRNEFANATDTSRSTAHFQACHITMGKRATFKMKVWGRMASTARTY
jgi:hypothetical protein